jgi:hypothetical protein
VANKRETKKNNNDPRTNKTKITHTTRTYINTPAHIHIYNLHTS